MTTYDAMCRIWNTSEEVKKKQYQQLLSLIKNYVSIIYNSLDIPVGKVEAAAHNEKPYVFATYEENGRFVRMSDNQSPPVFRKNGVPKINFQVAIVLITDELGEKIISIPCSVKIENNHEKLIVSGDVHQEFVVDDDYSVIEDAAEFFKTSVLLELSKS